MIPSPFHVHLNKSSSSTSLLSESFDMDRSSSSSPSSSSSSSALSGSARNHIRQKKKRDFIQTSAGDYANASFNNDGPNAESADSIGYTASSASKPYNKSLSVQSFDILDTIPVRSPKLPKNQRTYKDRKSSELSLTNMMMRSDIAERIPSSSSITHIPMASQADKTKKDKTRRSKSANLDGPSDENDSSQESEVETGPNQHPWTVEEDEILLEKQGLFGNKWANIASYLVNRDQEQIKTRFKSILRASRREWTTKEDDLLLQLINETESNWSLIINHFPRRTKNAIKKRYRFLTKIKEKPPSPPTLGAPNQVFFYRRYHQRLRDTKGDKLPLSIKPSQPAASPLRATHDVILTSSSLSLKSKSSDLLPSPKSLDLQGTKTTYESFQSNFAKPNNPTQQIWQTPKATSDLSQAKSNLTYQDSFSSSIGSEPQTSSGDDFSFGNIKHSKRDSSSSSISSYYNAQSSDNIDGNVAIFATSPPVSRAFDQKQFSMLHSSPLSSNQESAQQSQQKSRQLLKLQQEQQKRLYYQQQQQYQHLLFQHQQLELERLHQLQSQQQKIHQQQNSSASSNTINSTLTQPNIPAQTHQGSSGDAAILTMLFSENSLELDEREIKKLMDDHM